MSPVDIYAPPGGRCNKSERDGEKQTCCSWLRDGTLKAEISPDKQMNNEKKTIRATLVLSFTQFKKKAY